MANELFYAKCSRVYEKAEDYIADLKDNFLKEFKLRREDCGEEVSEVDLVIVQEVGLELLQLCLVELSKVKENKLPANLKELYMGCQVKNQLLSKVLETAGYWSNDIEWAFVDYLVKTKTFKASPFSSVREKANGVNMEHSCYTLIYKWLLKEYKLDFTL